MLKAKLSICGWDHGQCAKSQRPRQNAMRVALDVIAVQILSIWIAARACLGPLKVPINLREYRLRQTFHPDILNSAHPLLVRAVLRPVWHEKLRHYPVAAILNR